MALLCSVREGAPEIRAFQHLAITPSRKDIKPAQNTNQTSLFLFSVSKWVPYLFHILDLLLLIFAVVTVSVLTLDLCLYIILGRKK